MKTLGKYSVGVGDRFGQQAKAQLQACMLASHKRVEITPVWNKSNREHTLIGSNPASTRAAADAAVRAIGWRQPYYCDADHINLSTVDRFFKSCDFYTIDVADFIGRPAELDAIRAFVDKHGELTGDIDSPGAVEAICLTADQVARAAAKFLVAVREAARIYHKIEAEKGAGNFVAEISMDETDLAQTPAELLVVLAAIADERIPIQTIAPKFSGRFNKGVDYAGDVAQFARELRLDMAAIRHAISLYGLPANLKLSIHSGSDKFSIYPEIHEAINEFNTGIHIKTAGTTWLEELVGLAETGGSALVLAKEIYSEAYVHSTELCAPYATVIDVDPARLPSPSTVAGWASEQFTAALRHDSTNPAYNPSFRQLLHVAFKVAAKMGRRYLDMLEASEATIAKNVTDNLYNRHIAPVFLGTKS